VAGIYQFVEAVSRSFLESGGYMAVGVNGNLYAGIENGRDLGSTPMPESPDLKVVQ
jgi:hypothetical protein